MTHFVDLDGDESGLAELWMSIAIDGDLKLTQNKDAVADLYKDIFVDKYSRIIDPWWIPVLEYEADIERLDTDYDVEDS